MIKRKSIRLFILAVLVITVIAGCDVADQVTKAERIEKFMTALNSNPRVGAGINDHFVTGSADAETFDPEFDDDGVTTWSWNGETDSGYFSATSKTDISGTFSWEDTGDTLSGANWKIKKLITDGATYY